MIHVYRSNGGVTPKNGELTEYTLSGWYTLAARFEKEESALEFRRLNDNAVYSHTHLVDMEEMKFIYESSDTKR